jgi:secondary thiamine-phosphate synthase enzyme
VRGLGGDADVVDEGGHDGDVPELNDGGHAGILTTVVPAALSGDPDFAVFLQRTSPSLILCENADPDVRRDLETILSRLASDGDEEYAHDAEGPDDVASHARSILTSNSITIPVADGQLMLGNWQGVYLYEHRHAGHARSVVVTTTGDGIG